jgi:hypothetical protein
MTRIFPAFLSLFLLVATAQAAEIPLHGRVLDPQGRVLANAKVEVLAHQQMQVQAVTGTDGAFVVRLQAAGGYLLRVTVEGFRPVSLIVILRASGNEPIEVKMKEIAAKNESVMVSADVNLGDVLSPDPAMKVFATEDLLDANPGRPGAPISIPGYPIETASSGIKAPQYFAPGVAGDHGEPIAQYMQVGGYLVPNNLSANAHGNGYADPNIFIANVIESVQVDGGAYNVREGNHALNLAAIYGLRSHLEPFLTLTTDYRDLTATAGMSPSEHSWIAMEGSYGNGFLDRLEHRKQFKLNGGRVYQAGNHTLTLFGIAYYGEGFVAGLRPMYGFNSIDAAAGWVEYPDTIDDRQRDQTHTALFALNDHWKLGEQQSIDLSGFFRSYNLALFSDFGLGLIRQSEFRTVGGVSASYVKKFSQEFALLAGTDHEREAPRRDDLDHYNFFNPAAPYNYGPFVKIDGNNVTITSTTPYAAGEGELGKHLSYYLGWRRDEIQIDNQDLMNPANSWSKLVGVNSPKMTFSFQPGEIRALPLISFSFGKSFFTEDPREGTPLNGPTTVDPVETARSYQLVASKNFGDTELKLTLGHETQSAEYGKIDPDQGLQFDLGPGRIRFLAATLRQKLPNGALQVTFEEADARLLDVATASVTPEAPRLIGDVTATYQKLPFKLQMKGEFEYVGRKVVGTSCDATQPLTGGTGYCLGVPNKEFRLALSRTFLNGRVSAGLNTMLASGWTGQTTENFAAASVYGPGQVGLGANGLVAADPVNEVVGVRIPSYASVSVTWHFGLGR